MRKTLGYKSVGEVEFKCKFEEEKESWIMWKLLI